MTRRAFAQRRRIPRQRCDRRAAGVLAVEKPLRPHTAFLAMVDGRGTIRFWLMAEMLKASISMASPPRCCGINSLEIVEHGFDGCMEAIKVHAKKPSLRALVAGSSVPIPQPLDELGGNGISPHPRRESLNAAIASGSSLRPVT